LASCETACDSAACRRNIVAAAAADLIAHQRTSQRTGGAGANAADLALLLGRVGTG
jgi:hypothetical protein